MQNATSWSSAAAPSPSAPSRLRAPLLRSRARGRASTSTRASETALRSTLGSAPSLHIVRPQPVTCVGAPRLQSDSLERASVLMSRYAAGDERAFAPLYTLLRPRLARLCGSMVGAVQERDVLQEVFLKLHRGRASFVTGGNAVAWAYAVARRVCIDHLRAPVRTLELPMDHEQLDARGPGVAADEPSLRALLDERLGSLSDCLRTTYFLVKVEGLSCAEAATLLAISVSAVKQRVHRATAELRAELEGATCSTAAIA